MYFNAEGTDAKYPGSEIDGLSNKMMHRVNLHRYKILDSNNLIDTSTAARLGGKTSSHNLVKLKRLMRTWRMKSPLSRKDRSTKEFTVVVLPPFST